MNWKLLALTVLLALGPPAIAAERTVDVLDYEIEVAIGDEKLVERVVIHVAAAKPPKTWELELATAMEVRSAKVGGREIAVERDGWRLLVDLEGVKGPEFRLELVLDGSPRNQFSKRRGGYLRTVVSEEITHIRSQYAWYPRAVDDPATYRVRVDARKDWLVRTAGEVTSCVEADGRKRWRFESASPVRNLGLVAGPYATRELAAGVFLLDALVFPGDEEGADRLLETAKSAFDHYALRFGTVKMKRFTLVEMPAAFGKGSGYGEDGYVLLGKGAYEEGAAWAPSLVAHEVAHAWWGREVSFSEFASESLASYATLGWLGAEQGEAAARAMRRSAVERVLSSVSAGREIALEDIRGFGSGMDPRTYRAHAYEKGMMLLSMVEDALGVKALDRLLSRFLEENRGELVDYPTLRAALVKGGAAARSVVTQWEKPGLPLLSIEWEASPSGKRWRVKGTISQKGTARPFKMTVPVVAEVGKKLVTERVKLTRSRAEFSFVSSGKPRTVIIDPDWRLLVMAPRGGPADPEKVIDLAFKVVNSPGERDPGKCEETIAMLRDLLAAGAGKHEGLCHTGIGRCLFRLGKLEEAKAEFAEALRLGAGGPFHRRWIHLRLGCIADLEGDREKALSHYRKVVGSGGSGHTVNEAKRFIETPYRGE